MAYDILLNVMCLLDTMRIAYRAFVYAPCVFVFAIGCVLSVCWTGFCTGFASGGGRWETDNLLPSTGSGNRIEKLRLPQGALPLSLPQLSPSPRPPTEDLH